LISNKKTHFIEIENYNIFNFDKYNKEEQKNNRHMVNMFWVL